jgi:hypothetical protein
MVTALRHEKIPLGSQFVPSVLHGARLGEEAKGNQAGDDDGEICFSHDENVFFI